MRQRGIASVALVVALGFAISIGFNIVSVRQVNNLSQDRARDNKAYTSQIQQLAERNAALLGAIAKVGNDAIENGCKRLNRLRDALRFVELSLTQARDGARETLASSTATEQEKASARKSLPTLIDFVDKLHVALTNEKCDAPLPGG